MDVIDLRPPERKTVLLLASREELVERIGRALPQVGVSSRSQGCTYI